MRSIFAMRQLRSRKSIVLLCIGAVAFAAFLPLAQTGLYAVLTPLWLIVGVLALVGLRAVHVRRNQQTLSFFSVFHSRPPPTSLARA
jgi:hypothetical protein